MADHDPRVTAYIAKAPPFARPILEGLRTAIHGACPDIEEGIKWSRPFFSYRGSPLCMMAAFKPHCGFGFWLSKQVIGQTAQDGSGQFGKLLSIADLPPEKNLIEYIRKAMALNDAGIKLRRPKAAAKPAAPLPDALASEFATKIHANARKNFDAFTPGKQREYIEWINEARTDPTRQKRVATALQWLAEGKSLHWKYAKC